MARLLAFVVLGGIVLSVPALGAQSAQLASTRPDLDSENTSADLHALPPPPAGKSTILGGAIRDLDPVRDQFSLHIYGQRAMKILFDERTQVYRDGIRIPLRDLQPENHASVQTILDGTNVFAMSIHILSQSPEGDCQGTVLRYDPRSGVLSIRSAQSPDPVRLIVRSDTSIVREGETAFTSQSSGQGDLVTGALISATFIPAPGGHDIANHIEVLAVPGATFVFAGTISFLDIHSGALNLIDPRDGKSYQIHFDSARIAASRNLHPGGNVTVKAQYDGSRYQAIEITAD